ncbi:MAG: hypothetical protein RLZZ440_1561 [Planctomycetota bacterium]|jgi:prepilin signal peptidase PulO-like enzyme (type II secretory pathway)
MYDLSLPFAADLFPIPDWLALWPWAEAAVVLFGFAWGSLLGSFINVVVHRLPLGESVAGERSRCPHCRSPIRARDNLPVVGWLLLRGRCRSCGAAIAATYPLVEALCGGLVALLAAAELAGGGRWLAAPPTGYPQGVDRLLRGDWQLLATCCLHAGVVLMVVTWALLDRVGWKCPRSWLPPAVGLVLTVVAIAPPAAPPGLLADATGWPPGSATWQRLAASGLGATVGALVGLAGPGNAFRLGLPLLGGVLGWQLLAVVTIVTGLAAEIVRQVAPTRADPGGFGLGLAVTATAALAGHGALVAFWREAAAALRAALTIG